MIGIVTGTGYVGRVKNGTKKALFIPVKFTDSKDVKTVQFMPQSSIDIVPPKGAIVFVTNIDGIYIATSSYDGINSACNPGEIEIYSSSSSVKKARMKLKTGGTMFIGNSTYNLRTALQNLVTGIQGLTAGGYPMVDTTGYVATALTQIEGFLDATDA